MSPPLKDCRIILLWPEEGLKDKTWTPPKMKSWVTAAGGTLIVSGKLDRTFTHLVCDEKTYKEHDGFTEATVKDSIKILSLDWLVDTLHGQKKAPASQYLWSKLLKATRPMSTSRVMALFHQSTANHVTPEQQKALDQEIAAQNAAQKEREKQERQELEAKIRENNRACLARGGRKAHQSEFTDINHVWIQDDVKYEAFVYKANMAENFNERITLVIFETHEKPHKYSTYIVHEKTGGIVVSKTPVAYDTVPETALRQFKFAFKELTGMTWADRSVQVAPEGGQGFIFDTPLATLPIRVNSSADADGDAQGVHST